MHAVKHLGQKEYLHGIKFNMIYAFSLSCCVINAKTIAALWLDGQIRKLHTWMGVWKFSNNEFARVRLYKHQYDKLLPFLLIFSYVTVTYMRSCWLFIDLCYCFIFCLLMWSGVNFLSYHPRRTWLLIFVENRAFL